MSRHLGLRARVKRVEKRLGRRKPLPTIITGIYPEEQPGPIVSFEGNGGQRAELKPGETLPELQRRALALPGRMLRTCYRPVRAARSDETRKGATSPALTSEATPWPSLGDAGVGRVALRDELIRMGAIAIPAERLV